MNQDVRRISVLVFLAALAAGIFLRLHSISTQVVWHDEVVSLVRVAGGSRQDVTRALTEPGLKITRNELLRYQSILPGTTLTDDSKKIIESSLTAPNLPAYYLIARVWSELFGLSPDSLRLLSVALNLCAVACLLTLCARHLGGTAFSRYVAAAALLSPYFIAYAREARNYSLLLLIVTATTLFFFEHRRSKGMTNLAALLAVIISGLLSHLLYLPCLLLHLAYFSWRAPNSTRLKFLAVGIAALLAAAPWYAALLRAPELAHHFTADNPPESYLRGAVITASRLLFEPLRLAVVAGNEFEIGIGILLLLAAATLFFIKEKSAACAALVLWIPVSAALLLLDITAGGQRALFFRYLFPAALAETVVIGWVLWNGAHGAAKSRVFASIAGIVMILSSWSIYSAQSDPAWNRTPKIVKETIPVAGILDRFRAVPLVSTIPPIKLISIANHLEHDREIFPLAPKTRFDQIPELAPSGTLFLALTEIEDGLTARVGSAECTEIYHQGVMLLLRACRSR